MRTNFVDPYQARLEALAAEKKDESRPVFGAALRSTSTRLSLVDGPALSTVSSSTDTEDAASAFTPVKVTYTVTPGAFSLEQLKNALPEGVDPAQKEEYLSDAEFAAIFGMDKVAFRAMPKWKRDQNKKNKGLF